LNAIDGLISRAIVDKNGLPLTPGQRHAETLQQGVDIAALVVNRNDKGNLERHRFNGQG